MPLQDNRLEPGALVASACANSRAFSDPGTEMALPRQVQPESCPVGPRARPLGLPFRFTRGSGGSRPSEGLNDGMLWFPPTIRFLCVGGMAMGIPCSSERSGYSRGGQGRTALAQRAGRTNLRYALLGAHAASRCVR